jgi:hypothetical protein
MFIFDTKLALHPRLVLETPRPGVSRKRIFEKVCDQSTNIPPRKKVKLESSKALDDSAERAADEKLMLLGDTKHDKDFQPRFSNPSSTLTIDSQSLPIKKNGKRKRRKRRKLKLPMVVEVGILLICCISTMLWSL